MALKTEFGKEGKWIRIKSVAVGVQGDAETVSIITTSNTGSYHRNIFTNQTNQCMGTPDYLRSQLIKILCMRDYTKEVSNTVFLIKGTINNLEARCLYSGIQFN